MALWTAGRLLSVRFVVADDNGNLGSWNTVVSEVYGYRWQWNSRLLEHCCQSGLRLQVTMAHWVDGTLLSVRFVVTGDNGALGSWNIAVSQVYGYRWQWHSGQLEHCCQSGLWLQVTMVLWAAGTLLSVRFVVTGDNGTLGSWNIVVSQVCSYRWQWYSGQLEHCCQSGLWSQVTMVLWAAGTLLSVRFVVTGDNGTLGSWNIVVSQVYGYRWQWYSGQLEHCCQSGLWLQVTMVLWAAGTLLSVRFVITGDNGTLGSWNIVVSQVCGYRWQWYSGQLEHCCQSFQLPRGPLSSVTANLTDNKVPSTQCAIVTCNRKPDWQCSRCPECHCHL